MTKRNDELFAAIHNRHRSRLLRYFVRVFRVSEPDAQDLTQETFLRFYRSMDEYRGDAEWALLETIGRNVAFNRARSLTTQRRGAIRPESLDNPDTAHRHPAAEQIDPVDRMITEQRRARLRQAIAELPKGQRVCMQLWLEGWKYEQIAKSLKISLDAVKSRIRDAKRALRERLGDEVALPEDES